ncbi:hypothetical protein GB937_003930 [Aspergillus fischeri]|nr:hypothetical protein GB937_003930 [Aspergillus fischeri]
MRFIQLEPTTTRANTTIFPPLARCFLHPPPSSIHLQLSRQKSQAAQLDPEQDVLVWVELNAPQSLSQTGSR